MLPFFRRMPELPFRIEPFEDSIWGRGARWHGAARLRQARLWLPGEEVKSRSPVPAMAESLATFVIANFEAHRHEQAYRQRRGYRTESFTYGQVAQMAYRFARELEARQISKGDRVVLWGENCAEWAVAFFGCALTGVVVVPMDNGASPDFVARVSNQVAGKLFLCSRRNALAASTATGGVAPVLMLEDLSQT